MMRRSSRGWACSLRRATMPATTGEEAEVPATPAMSEVTETQYGFCIPPSAATSG